MKKHEYSRPQRAPFPRVLAVGIARKASNMAARFEEQAIKQMVRDAQRALDRGVTAPEIEHQLGLK